jgi:hypothetical protein
MIPSGNPRSTIGNASPMVILPPRLVLPADNQAPSSALTPQDVATQSQGQEAAVRPAAAASVEVNAGPRYELEVDLPAARVPASIESLAQWISEHKVEVVCWDFDETAMRIHTGGFVRAASEPELQQRLDWLSHQVAPEFRLFSRYIERACPGVRQAIVSFADDFSRNDPPSVAAASKSVARMGGTDLIKTVLERGFGWPRPAFRIVSFYPDVANSRQEFPHHVSKNKNVHMQQVAKHMGILSADRLLLIDNCPQNCHAAIEFGAYTWHVSASKGFDTNSLRILSSPTTTKLLNSITDKPLLSTDTTTATTANK